MSRNKKLLLWLIVFLLAIGISYTIRLLLKDLPHPIRLIIASIIFFGIIGFAKYKIDGYKK